MNFLRVAIVTLFLPSVLFAADQVEIVRQCLSDLADGNKNAAMEKAYLVKDFINITNREVAFKGKRCLNRSLKTPFGFDLESNRFITGEELEQKTALTAALIERQTYESDQDTLARLQHNVSEMKAERSRLLNMTISELEKTPEQRAWDDNKQRVIAESYAACVNLYVDKPFAAMTNQLCVLRFIEFGMPK